MNRFKLMAMVAGAALVVSACSGGYDRQETIDDLVTDAGVDEATATCIVDGMEAQIGEDRLGERGDPTAEEEEIIVDITTECILGGLDG
ncbi:MAG: hypothetical protein AAF962_05995 [Actinomycetota bacterium]